MEILVYPNPTEATTATADWLAQKLADPTIRNVMVAGGNTPLALYAAVAERRPNVSHLNLFALDEYVGVPLDEPRNCANLLRRTVVEAWGAPVNRYFPLSSLEAEAHRSILEHEARIDSLGGLDLVILGLGKNGHIGFNEPGSTSDSPGRLLPLDEISIEANRQWFEGDYAPSLGVTTGMKTLLAARSILLLAFGTLKAPAVAAMLEGSCDPACPASLLQQHANVRYVIDEAAAAELLNR
jgi:glucosamine-6-phosphate deaminase